MKRVLIMAGGLIGAGLTYLQMPEMVDELGRRAAGIFVFAAVFWASRVIPLFATSLAVVIASILLLALVLLAIAGAMVHWFYKSETKERFTGTVKTEKLTLKSWATLGVLVFAITAWLTGEIHQVPDGVIALSAAAMLAVLGLLEGDDLKDIEWPVLILMWGGLTLGLAIEGTGLVAHLGNLPLAQLPNFVLAGIVVAVAVALSSFISNTATAALLVPIVLALAVPEEGLLVVIAALACSFAMAMPVSTPPNALTYGTGRINVTDLIRLGGTMAVVAIVLMMAGYRIIVPLTLPVGTG